MKRIGRLFIGLGTVAFVGALWSATPAAAHTPSATPSCTGLSLQMANYPGPGTPNRVTVTVDAAVVIDAMFGESYATFVSWSDTDDHTWKVVVDDVVPDGDATFSGVQHACVTTTTPRPVMETTTTAPAPTTTEQVTTTTEAATTTTASLGVVGAATSTTTTTAVASLAVVPVVITPTPIVAPATPVVTPQVGSAGGFAAVAPAEGELPTTGTGDRTTLLIVGAAATAIGLAMIAAARRRAA